MAKIDYQRHAIHEAQALIKDRPDLTVGAPWRRPQGPRDRAFELIMENFAVPELNFDRRAFSCILYWPPLNDPYKKVDSANPKMPAIWDGQTKHPILRTVWDFFMGPSNPHKRVIQLCAEPNEKGGPGRNLCININHLALTDAHNHTSIPLPMPQEAMHQLLVLGLPRIIVADNLGCSMRDVSLWLEELPRSERTRLEAEGREHAWATLKTLYRAKSEAFWEEVRTTQRRALELERTKLAQLNRLSSIANPIRYLPHHWDDSEERFIHPSERTSGLLIGTPASKSKR